MTDPQVPSDPNPASPSEPAGAPPEPGTQAPGPVSSPLPASIPPPIPSAASVPGPRPSSPPTTPRLDPGPVAPARPDHESSRDAREEESDIGRRLFRSQFSRIQTMTQVQDDPLDSPAGNRARFGGVALLDTLALGGVATAASLLPWMAPAGIAEGPGGLILVGLVMMASLAAVVAHYRLGSQRLYWSGFDLIVLMLFGWMAGSVFLGEIPELTHPALGVATVSLAAWFVGRLTAWRRFVWMGAFMAAACVVAAFGTEASTAEPGAGSTGLLAGRLSGESLPLLCVAGLWAASATVAALFRRPPGGMGGLAVLAILVVGALLGYRSVMGILSSESATTAWKEAWRQALNLIHAYPIAGIGWGTWPVVGNAWSHGQGVLTPPGGDLTVVAVELGPVAGLVLFGLLLLMPLAAWRSRHTYPFRRMRLTIGMMQALILVMVLMALWGFSVLTGPLSPGLWMVLGTLAGMFQVRDPARAFGGSLVLPGTERRGFGGALVRGVIIGAVGLITAIPPVSQIMAGPAQPEGESVRGLQRAVALWPRSGELQLRLAEAIQKELRDRGRTIADVRTAARIEAALTAAVAANPYRAQAHEALYFWHRDSNDPARALEAIRAGVRYNPDSLELRLLLVRELERGGSLALATHHLKFAALRTTGADQGNLMLQLAELFEQRGLKDQARRWWQYAQQVDDLSAQTQSRLRRLGERLSLLGPTPGRR